MVAGSGYGTPVTASVAQAQPRPASSAAEAALQWGPASHGGRAPEWRLWVESLSHLHQVQSLPAAAEGLLLFDCQFKLYHQYYYNPA